MCCTGKEAVTVEAETHQNNDSVSQSEPEAQQNVPESQQEEPEAAWPEYFEPGRYEGVRPDLEIDMGGLRIGADLKTISMWNIKQEGLRAKLHREIIDRDYHLSAAMYCETAALDQFFWIFVNKDENYHWVSIIEASTELLELGMLEYRKTMRAIANGFDTGEWPAPITEDYTDELNDFDVRRLEALRVQA